MSKLTFVAATNNAGKLREIHDILETYGFDCISLKEAGIESDPEETGETFEENAVIKAKSAAALTDMPVLADDSGVMVDYLGGPGVHTARYAGEHATNDQNIDKLLYELRGVPKEKRGAKFCCCMAAIIDGKVYIANGECHGYIGETRLGTGGFGYNPVFYFSENCTMATLPEEEKNKISHRGRALKALCEQLKEIYA